MPLQFGLDTPFVPLLVCVRLSAPSSVPVNTDGAACDYPVATMDFYSQYLCCTLTQVAWIVGSAFWFWRRRDELPLVISGFLAYVFSFRFWALLNGLTTPVDISPFGFEPMSFSMGLEAQWIAVLSETTLLAAYMITQKRTLSAGTMTASPALLKWMTPFTFVFAALAIPVALVARWMTGLQLESGKVMAFEVSAYLYELPLMLISVALLLALLWKCGGLRNTFQRVSALLIIGLVAVLTFGPTGRFQFLGWVLAVTIIMSAGNSQALRIIKMAIGFGLAIVLFGVAGALRNTDDDASLGKDAWERLFFAEDANMLDGLVLLREVYPARLPYEYGGGHLEILERPIPRALWPDKPVGGYMNKLGIISVGTGFTLGISPGLVGSFYQEGGSSAVVILSALYGYGLGRLVRFSTRITPFAGALIRAICCASMIPLLRGGDLPGIYAWIFMAFWPCFLVLVLCRRELFGLRRSVNRGWRGIPRLRPVRSPAPGTLRST